MFRNTRSSSEKAKSEDEEEKTEPMDAQAVVADESEDFEMIELGERIPSQNLPIAQSQQQAVPLTPRMQEEAGSLPVAHVTVQAQVIEKVRARPRQYCAGFCCFFVLVTFLLAFLLIPRAPSLRLNKVYFSQQSNEQITITVRISSRSLVETEWRNLDLDLEWITDTTGPFDVATFSTDNSVTTSAFGAKSIQPDLDSTVDSNLNDLRRLCAQSGEATLRVRGHIVTDSSRFRVESDWGSTECQ
uniref:Uncharacterized protein n=1 Tax=Aureoumbra lagunensis TaxID=44058 RepID=A0A7S3JSA5_9STRA|mmetsp:Transcript_75/g.133  ORF Transcript_75/g.133 Transcript_75/m.133 type:complete len:244 (+) Transcript_75:76-807(+)